LKFGSNNHLLSKHNIKNNRRTNTCTWKFDVPSSVWKFDVPSSVQITTTLISFYYVLHFSNHCFFNFCIKRILTPCKTKISLLIRNWLQIKNDCKIKIRTGSKIILLTSVECRKTVGMSFDFGYQSEHRSKKRLFSMKPPISKLNTWVRKKMIKSNKKGLQ
jgi:hypothetical protein